MSYSLDAAATQRMGKNHEVKVLTGNHRVVFRSTSFPMISPDAASPEDMATPQDLTGMTPPPPADLSASVDMAMAPVVDMAGGSTPGIEPKMESSGCAVGGRGGTTTPLMLVGLLIGLRLLRRRLE